MPPCGVLGRTSLGRALSVVAAALVLTGAASASGRVALNAVGPKLAVSRDGRTALVTYGEAGRVRHALVWGAVDVSQVRFRIDWSGGWASFHRLVWKGFRNFCRPYDGTALSQLVAACKAPDGSYWALQAWQPNLPHRGYPPWKAGQSDWELDVSHWTGALAELEVHADWAFGHAHDLFGK